jgi:hypothetical protein
MLNALDQLFHQHVDELNQVVQNNLMNDQDVYVLHHWNQHLMG